MAAHRLSPLSQCCIGCDAAARDLADFQPARRGRAQIGTGPECPASYELINDERAGMLEVISAPDRLVIMQDGGEVLRLGPAAARALIYAMGGSC